LSSDASVVYTGGANGIAKGFDTTNADVIGESRVFSDSFITAIKTVD